MSNFKFDLIDKYNIMHNEHKDIITKTQFVCYDKVVCEDIENSSIILPIVSLMFHGPLKLLFYVDKKNIDRLSELYLSIEYNTGYYEADMRKRFMQSDVKINDTLRASNGKLSSDNTLDNTDNAQYLMKDKSLKIKKTIAKNTDLISNIKFDTVDSSMNKVEDKIAMVSMFCNDEFIRSFDRNKYLEGISIPLCSLSYCDVTFVVQLFDHLGDGEHVKLSYDKQTISSDTKGLLNITKFNAFDEMTVYRGIGYRNDLVNNKENLPYLSDYLETA